MMIPWVTGKYFWQFSSSMITSVACAVAVVIILFPHQFPTSRLMARSHRHRHWKLFPALVEGIGAARSKGTARRQAVQGWGLPFNGIEVFYFFIHIGH